jgi:hypothetical protein
MSYLGPRPVGAVIIGDGSGVKQTQLVRSLAVATRMKSEWLRRFAYTATVVPVFSDGTVAGGNSTAKTYLQGLSYKRLRGPGIDQRRAKRLKT